jgi:hypothetical protein
MGQRRHLGGADAGHAAPPKEGVCRAFVAQIGSRMSCQLQGNTLVRPPATAPLLALCRQFAADRTASGRRSDCRVRGPSMPRKSACTI